MNAKQRRVARRAMARRIAAQPAFLLEALGRTYATRGDAVAAAKRLIRVRDITVELGPR